MNWATSDRRSRLPEDWPKRVALTKERAHNRCEGISLNGEERWHVAECNGFGAECDHDKRGDDHRVANLRWLSNPCHTRKTQLEKPQRKRPRRTHPGDVR